MKIGIMGGTFDPVHNGHLMLAEYASHDYKLDQVWFMPNAHPPHKDNKTIVSSPEERAEMVRIAIRGYQNFRLEDYELNRRDISCSYQTMEYFREQYPSDHFYFIIGADSLFAIEQWVHVERLFPTCTILAAFRGDKNNRTVMEERILFLNQKYGADIRLLETPLMDISSHELREMLKNNEQTDLFIPEAVMDFIRSRHLYQVNSLQGSDCHE